MKKEKLIALLTIICMSATPVFAETGLKIADEKKDDVIALKDLGISVTADHYTTIREDDDELVYIYTNEDESIPYIIIGQYEFTSDDFADDFTEYMNKQCDDLEETSRDSITINGLEFDRVTYEYTVSGYDAKDTRLFHETDDSTYMFGMKEVPELDYMVDYDYLEDVAGSMKPLKDKNYDNYVDSNHDITEERITESEKMSNDIFTVQLEKTREFTDMSNIRAAFAEVMAEYMANGSNKAYCIEVSLNQQEDGWQDVENGKLYAGIDDVEKQVYITDDIVGPSKTVYINIDSDGTVTVTATALDGAFNIYSNEKEEIGKEYENYVDSEHDITEEKKSETEKIVKNDIEKKKDGNKVENREEEVESIFDIPKKERNKENDEENIDEETIRFKKSMASYSGTWVPVEDQFQFYLPNTWNEFIPSDEQKELGTIYQAGDARALDGENAPYISVNMGDAQGIDSMEELKEEMENDYNINGFVDVNGIECLSYSYDDPNLSGMMFFYPDDPDYVLAVVAYNYDDFEDILGPVLCSISPI